MSNPSKNKGTRAETAFTAFAREHGFPYADRLTQTGRYDRGDVGLCPGCIAEVKDVASYSPNVPPWAWLAETEKERVNANAVFALLVCKPRGIGYNRVGEWHAWLPVWAVRGWLASGAIGDAPVRMRVVDALLLLREYGYGNPPEDVAA